jgi:adenine-specific DNA-methyltransferase
MFPAIRALMPFLDWVNKSQATSVAKEVPYHLLRFESAHGDTRAENLLIQGDNLLALKALLPFYRGQVKCIFIDPPYNTQSAFEHYDDKLEHSQWLSMMYPHGGHGRGHLAQAHAGVGILT